VPKKKEPKVVLLEEIPKGEAPLKPWKKRRQRKEYLLNQNDKVN
jgi:hypothetical protein